LTVKVALQKRQILASALIGLQQTGHCFVSLMEIMTAWAWTSAGRVTGAVTIGCGETGEIAGGMELGAGAASLPTGRRMTAFLKRDPTRLANR
jgi:hypothetical protein